MISNLEKLNNNLDAKKIFQIINSGEEEVVCLFVGGCVRDLISNKDTLDIDFATSLPPNKIKKKLEASNIIFDNSFENYGSIKITLNNKNYEVNTLRKDLDYDGRHANVLFTQDWRQDALRRDFTINAIYCDLNGRVYDPFKGIDDLKNGIVRFIGDPIKRIQQDFLRALRYFRFFIQFSKNNHDEYIINCIKKNQNKIEDLSKAKLLEEFRKVLLSGKAYKLFQDSFVKDLYLSVYKGIKYLTRLEFERKKKILSKDVDWVVLLSLLLVDQTKNFERFVKDFQLSNEIKNRLSNLQSQFTFKTVDKIEKTDYLKKSVLKYGQPSVIDYIHFQYLINEKYDYSLYEKNLKVIKETASPKFEFDVNILKKKGFKDDKNLGNALNFIKQRWIANNFQIRDKDIDDAVQLFK